DEDGNRRAHRLEDPAEDGHPPRRGGVKDGVPDAGADGDAQPVGERHQVEGEDDGPLGGAAHRVADAAEDQADDAEARGEGERPPARLEPVLGDGGRAYLDHVCPSRRRRCTSAGSEFTGVFWLSWSAWT